MFRRYYPGDAVNALSVTTWISSRSPSDYWHQLGVFRKQLNNTDQFPEVQQKLQGVPSAAKGAITRKAFGLLTPAQRMDLIAVGDPKQYAWMKLHEGDGKFKDLSESQKLSSMSKEWAALNGGTKKVTPASSVKAARSSYQQLPPMQSGWGMLPPGGSAQMPMMMPPQTGYPPYMMPQQQQFPTPMPMQPVPQQGNFPKYYVQPPVQHQHAPPPQQPTMFAEPVELQ